MWAKKHQYGAMICLKFNMENKEKSMEKVIEVNLGIGMNMLFPETVKIVIEDDTDDETTKKSSKVKPEIEIEKE